MRTELVDRDKLMSWMVSEENMEQPMMISRVWHWATNPANLVDLLAIMPWFLTKAFESSGSGDSVIIRFIRLTRVIRAARLGKRFEAVIIVVRSVRRSLRALYVLVLNLVLGVITFGALMYFCEQGDWDPDKQAYMRLKKISFNEETKIWEDVLERSPFDSIPSCFWWAIITATTVGYGDMYPTTNAGKAVAGLAMGWSLCVLALPIGVIGNNFSNVWNEYDLEKKREREHDEREEMMLKRSDAWGDPLHYSRRIILEVWHDNKPGHENGDKDGGDGELMEDECAEFMGEVDVSMTDLEPKEFIQKTLTMPLTMNMDKARRRVRGTLTFEYIWRPNSDKADLDPKAGPELHGELEVIVHGAADLITIDWKGCCDSDPYVNVITYPCGPGPDGMLHPKCQKTRTVLNTSYPSWNDSFKFNMHWTKAGAESCMAADMRNLDSGHATEAAATEGVGHIPGTSIGRKSLRAPQAILPPELTDDQKEELLHDIVPSLQEDVATLREVVPQIQSSIKEVKRDLQLIASVLRKRSLVK